MKRVIILLIICSGSAATAQGIKLTGFGGYTLQDKVYGYYGDIIIKDGAHYGAMLSYEKDMHTSIDLTYSYQSTSFSIRDYSTTGNTGAYKGSVSYIMLGTRHSPDFTAKVAPYAGGMLGAAFLTPEKFSQEVKFAVGLKLGAIYHASDKVGIMIQTQLMVPVQGVGIGVGCGSGGCGGGTYTSSTATQLGFTGGVEIKLNN